MYPTWDGGGTVALSVLGADYLPASPTLVKKVQETIDPPPGQGLGLGLAPIGAKVTVKAPDKVTINVSATVTLAAGYDIGQVKPLVQQSIEEYLLGVRKEWATQLGDTAVEYGRRCLHCSRAGGHRQHSRHRQYTKCPDQRRHGGYRAHRDRHTAAGAGAGGGDAQ